MVTMRRAPLGEPVPMPDLPTFVWPPPSVWCLCRHGVGIKPYAQGVDKANRSKKRLQACHYLKAISFIAFFVYFE